MPEPKPIVKKVRGGYTVQWGQYTARIKMALRSSGVLAAALPINARIFIGNGRQSLAWFQGTRTSETAHFYELYPSKEARATKSEGLKTCGVLLQSVETVLRENGVETVRGRTHPGFARFMQQMGYGETGSGPGYRDMEKNIKENPSKLPFRLKPLTKKKPKKPKPLPKRRRPR